LPAEVLADVLFIESGDRRPDVVSQEGVGCQFQQRDRLLVGEGDLPLVVDRTDRLVDPTQHALRRAVTHRIRVCGAHW